MPDTHITKKRRTENQFAVGIYDEDDARELKSDDRVSRPESRHSVNSGRVSWSGSKDNRSEFGRAHDLANSHRKKSRAGSSRVTNGDATLPISIDDDDEEETPNRGKTSRQMQLQAFQQGIDVPAASPTRRRLSETTSSHFRPKMNHSTHPTGVSKQKSQKSDYLRNQFHRATPLSKTKWPLEWARAHHCSETDEPGLFLRSNDEYNYSITGAKRDDVRCEFTFHKINKAYSDNQSRVRLSGSTDSNDCRYEVDIVFLIKEDLHQLLQAVARSITQQQVVVKSTKYMRVIFEKPLEMPSQSPNATSAPTIVDEVRPSSSGSRKARLIYNLRSDETTATSPEQPKSTHESTAVRNTGRPVRATRQNRNIGLDLDDYEDTIYEKYSVIHGLGQPWRKQLEYGSGRNRAVVDYTDLPRLDDGEFLNDSLINFYLLYLKDQAKASGERVKVFNTHLFDTLTRRTPGQRSKINYQGVARWTRHEDIFGYDYIVVPINQDLHWYLAIICNVSNIARVPAIEDLTQSESLNSEGPKDATKDEEKAGESAGTKSSPTLVDKTPDSPVPVAQPAELDAEASDLDVVDGHASGFRSHRNAASGSPSAVESPAEATARLDKLSLNDNKSSGVSLGGKSASSPKKTKRRGPPRHKYNPNEPVVIVLDSLYTISKSNVVQVLKDYIKAEGEDKRGMHAEITQNGFYAKTEHVPQQRNSHDCGVYVLGYAQKFFEDPDGFRNRLLSGEMRADTDWPDMDVEKMRGDIRGILQGLYSEQAARNKEKRAEKGAKMDTATTPAEMNDPDISSVAKTVELASEETLKDEGTESEKMGPITKEHATVLPDKQSQSRLASPFDPQSSPKRSRTRSHSLVVPIKVDGSPSPPARHLASSDVTSREASSQAEVPRRHHSPAVVIPSPARKSPKRPIAESFLDGADEKTAKRPRTATKQSPKQSPKRTTQQTRATDSRSPVIAVRSPSPKPSNPHRRPKISLSSPPRGAKFPSRGSSRDPIHIDDSQDSILPASSPIKSKIRRLDVYEDEEPDIIITSPHPNSKSGVRSTSQHQGYHSSPPTKLPARRKSPYFVDDVDVLAQSRALDYFAQRAKKDQRRRRAEEDEGKAWEVPETPPPPEKEARDGD